MAGVTWLALLALMSLGSALDSSQGKDVFLPHDTDIKLYYLWNGNDKLLFSCPENYLFDVNSRQCKRSVETGCDKVFDCDVSLWGHVYPYPKDCSKYVYCDESGNSQISSCLKGLHFSPELLRCVSPEEANCPFCEVSIVETLSGTSVPTCSAEDEGLKKPYPGYCSLYIYCGESGGEVSFCPAGLHFSPVELTCMPKETAGCEVEPSTTEEATTPATTEAPTESTVGICPPNPECLSSEIGYNKPYPPDCTKFIYCNAAGPGRLRPCPINLLFSPDLQYCTPPEESNCRYCEVLTTTPEPTTIETTIGFCPPTPTCSAAEVGQYKPYPPDCTQYIYCEDEGEEFLSLCPPGQHFSPDLLRCTTPEVAKCPLCEVYISTTTLGFCSETPKCKESDFGFNLPYPPDCTMFIYCDEPGDGELSQCRLGQEFSPELLRCVPAAESNCPICIEITTTEEPAPPTIPYCLDTPIYCLSSEIGANKPYPPDCTKFIHCKAEGPGSMRNCPINQEFDPVLLYCAPAEEANCPYCQISTTTESSPSTELTISVTDPTTTESTTQVPTSTTTETTTSTTTETPTTTSTTTEIPTSTTTETPTSTTTETSTSTTTETSTSTTTEITNTCTTAAPTAEGECPQIPTCCAGEKGVKKRYPPDCNSYIECVSNEPSLGVIQKCFVLFWFNPVSTRCELLPDTGCNQCTPPTTPQQEPTTQLPTTKFPICSPTPDCSAAGDGDTLPYPPDCTSYIYCQNSMPKKSACPVGNHFSPTLARCVKPDIAKCQFCVEESLGKHHSQSQPSLWNFWAWLQ